MTTRAGTTWAGNAEHLVVEVTRGAIVESRHIRAHMDKHDLHNVTKKPRKEGSFMQRLAEAAEARKQMLEQSGKMPKRAKGPGKLPQASKPDKFERRYKKK